MLRSRVEEQGTEAIGGYIRRARQERELASRASTAEGAQAHLRLARHYEALIRSADASHEEGAAADYPGLAVNGAVQTRFGLENRGAATRLASFAERY